MSILRKIKLKSLNGELDNLEEMEVLFFSLFNNLTSETIYKREYISYNNETFFMYDIENNHLWCDYYNVFGSFDMYNMTTADIASNIKDFLNKRNIVSTTVDSTIFIRS